MKKKKGMVTFPGIVMLGLSGVGTFSILSYLQLRDIIEHGIAKIDASDEVPSWIRTAIHAFGLLPKSVPLKYIVKTMMGTEEEKNRYISMVQELSKYFTIKVTKQ